MIRKKRGTFLPLKFLIVFVFMTVFALSIAAQEIIIDVDPSCTLDIGGPLIKPTLFGVTAFEGFPSVLWDVDFRSKIEACRFGAFRFPAQLAWCSPEKDDLNWYQSQDALHLFSGLPLYGDRYVYGRFLPVVRALGAEPIPCLLSPPAWMVGNSPIGMPKDWDLWGRHCAEYLKLWRKFYPDLKYFQLWNEPNSTFFRDQEMSKAHGGDGAAYADFFNATVKAVKAVHPELKSLGPVLCWPPAWPPGQPGQSPWYTWEGYTLPYLERCKDTADYYDFHAYDINPEDLVVQTSLVAAHSSKIRSGKPMLSWITESSYVINCEPSDWDDLQAEWERRALPYERFLLTLINNQDIFEGNTYHDISGGGSYCLFNRKGQETGVYNVFWILRNLRGRRVLVECKDPNLRVAASVEPERLAVIVFNDSDKMREFIIKVRKPNNQYCNYAGAEVILPPATKEQAARREKLAAQAKDSEGTISIAAKLPPFATGAFYAYPVPGFPQHSAITVRQYFGEELLQFLEGNKASANVTLMLPEDALSKGSKVFLRIGLMEPDKTERYRVQINGMIEREIAAKALQEIDVHGLLRSGQNGLRVYVTGDKPNPSRALGFISAVVREKR